MLYLHTQFDADIFRAAPIIRNAPRLYLNVMYEDVEGSELGERFEVLLEPVGGRYVTGGKTPLRLFYYSIRARKIGDIDRSKPSLSATAVGALPASD